MIVDVRFWVFWTGLVSSLVSAAIPGLAPEKKWDVSGYVNYRLMVTDPAHQSHSIDQMLHQRVNAEYRFEPGLRLNAGMRNRLIWGDSTETPDYAASVAQDQGYFDLSSNWLENRSEVGNSQLDRFYFTWNHQDWQIKGGRQRVNWSMATIWNPNDILNTYSLYEIDYAERPGADALLISRKTGYAGGVELVYNPGQERELTGYSGRYFFNTQGWDLQLLGGKSGLDYVLGAGVAGDIKGAGLRGELSWFHPELHNWRGRETESTLVSTLEVDYSFAGKMNWSVKAAWLYISHPEDVLGAASFLSQSFNARRLSFSRHSYYAEVGFDVSSLHRISLSEIYYQDGSVYLNLSNQYSIADNWQFLGGAQYFGGSGNSIYGQTENTLLYALVKWSF